MKFNITDEDSLTKIQENIESNAGALDTIVNDIIAPYCRDLDKYVGFIKECLKDGENPIKAGGKIFIIDGGISKAYHKTTGIAGYTAIFTSKHLYLAEHQPYEPLQADGTQVFHRPKMHLVHSMPERLRIRDTDNGAELREQIHNLEALHEAFRSGRIREIYD